MKAFTCTDPKSSKNTVKMSIFFTLFGSALVKAVHIHVDEFDPIDCSHTKILKQLHLRWQFQAQGLSISEIKLSSLKSASRVGFSYDHHGR